ncbi:MAG: hypothetical protein WA474_16000 [Candidatus Sulfotelmatobacter sp.]
MFRNAFVVCILLILASMASHYAMAVDSCQPVFDAMSKVLVTPAHVFSTEGAGARAGAKPQSESIYFGGAIYVKLSNKWIRSKMTVQQMLEQEKENREHGTATCRYLREEIVGGEVAAVYSAHSENEDVKSDGQVWISKKGLPLREELDTDVGDPSKIHHSLRYEYSNVQAPPI